MTMGIVRVACIAAWTAGAIRTTITSTGDEPARPRVGETLLFPLSVAVLDRKVLPHNPAEVMQALLECLADGQTYRIKRRAVEQVAYAGDLLPWSWASAQSGAARRSG